MDNEQINRAILEALSKSQGDKQAAVKLLSTLCARDDQVLRDLVRPFLGPILLHRVDQVINRVAEDKKAKLTKGVEAPPTTDSSSATAVQPAAQVPPEVMEQLVDALGTAIPVGQPRGNDQNPLSRLGIGPGDIPPPVAGARHQRAMQALALSFKYKGK
ncbi:MAG: hypothetical protein QM523_02755 [Candidatus Pacebacteria bacterium]|nr:hypothetical protein [Candidatus Paceibacterota bacterium]